MAFTKRDSELFDILAQATKDELILLSKIISEKWSSNIDEFCTDPYKITKEIQLMGGNSIANKYRGHGVTYRELAYDAAKKVGANVVQGDTISTLEWKLLTKLLQDAESKLSEEDKTQLFNEINKKGKKAGFDFKVDSFKLLAKNPALYTIIIDLALPQILRMLGVQAAVMFVGGRAILGAIPVIGWGAAVGSTVHSIAGTAFSVTIPCTAIIGSIRARLEAEEVADNLKGMFE